MSTVPSAFAGAPAAMSAATVSYEMVREPAAFRARTSSSGLSAWALYSDILFSLKNYSHGG